MRLSGRLPSELRDIHIEPDVSLHAEGSCFVRFGDTHVLCTASVEESVPPFLKGKGQGWVTAEYSMLPRATHSRCKRESSQGKLTGRTQEIQRLISRSLRVVTELPLLGERQIIIDCDVIQADGGTRTASITGGYVALYRALQNLMKRRMLHRMPIIGEVAAISCGIVDGTPLIDLDYSEDSKAEVDANFVMTSSGGIVEIQGTAEQAPFSEAQLSEMLVLSKKGIQQLITLQRDVLKKS